MQEVLTTGEFAQLNCVSRKALRIYHEMGLLVPEYVDEETGYRYYTVRQSSVLDMITQLREIGFSLSEMKEIMDRADAAHLRETLFGYAARLEEQIRSLQAAKYAAHRMIRQCDFLLDKPRAGLMRVETLPRRRKLIFRTRGMSFEKGPNTAEASLGRWEGSLRMIKRQFMERDLPLSLFGNLGGVISAEALKKRALAYSQTAFLFIDDEFDLPADEFLEGGDFACYYCGSMVTEDGLYAEDIAMVELLDFIEREGLEIIGDYHGEVLADAPTFCCPRRDFYLKLQIPVRVPEGYPRVVDPRCEIE